MKVLSGTIKTIKLNEKEQSYWGFIRYNGGSYSHTISPNQNSTKEVWIITKSKTRLIKVENNVSIKEISVHDLCKIVEHRLMDISYEKTTLNRALINLGHDL